MDSANKTRKRVLTGVVVSDKMEKTIVVKASTYMVHRLYKKYVQQSKKVKAHDETNDANEGDTVRIIEARPTSRHKRWKLLEIVERAR